MTKMDVGLLFSNVRSGELIDVPFATTGERQEINGVVFERVMSSRLRFDPAYAGAGEECNSCGHVHVHDTTRWEGQYGYCANCGASPEQWYIRPEFFLARV